MEYSQFCEECTRIFRRNALPDPTQEQLEKLHFLTEYLLKVNQSMNLTAIRDEKQVILKHYADSLTLLPYLPEGAKMLDVGCGAGFPTLPIAIFRPDLQITALDSTAKRIEFVKSVATQLNLSHVFPVAARAEDVAHDPQSREHFDVVTARAVAALPVLAELCLPLCRIGGMFLAMKAKQAPEEILAARNAIGLCGGGICTAHTISLISDDNNPAETPNSDCRTLLEIKKISQTPKIYPRHFSKIAKKPL